MGVFANLRRFLTKGNAPADLWRFFGFKSGPASLAYENAYALVGWVNRCVRVIADNAKGVPVKALRRRRERGGKIRLELLPETHSFAKLLERPHPEEDFSSVIENTVTHLMLRGEAFWELEVLEGRGKEPVWINVFPPQFLTEVKISGNRYDSFELRVDTRKFSVPGEDAVFFKLVNPKNPWRGLAPMSAALMAAESDYNAQKFNARFFDAAPSPAVILRFEEQSNVQRLTPEDRERIGADIQRLYGGVGRQQGSMILGPGEILESVGAQVKDMSFASLRRWNRDEICAVFGVPPLLLGNVDNANRSNSKEQRGMFWQETMLPLIGDISSLVNRKLAKRYGDDIVALFDLSQVPALRQDMGALFEWLVPATTNGIMLINEARTEYLDKPPVPWGDQWWHTGTDVPTGVEGEDTDPVRGILTPASAKALLEEWCHDTICRIKAGAKDPVNAFPCGRQAKKAAKKYSIPVQEAWNLARAIFGELALTMLPASPLVGVEAVFERHIASLPADSGVAGDV